MEKGLTYLHDFFITNSLEESTSVDPKIVKSFQEKGTLLDGGNSFFWLINYFKRAPEFVSDSVKQVLGYHKAFLNNSNMAQYLRLVAEDDRLLLMKVFADIHDHYQKISLQDKGVYRFDFNYRVQRSDHRFISVVQQIMFLQSSPNGFPLIELSLLTDFSTYINNLQIQLQVFKLENGGYEKVTSLQYDDNFDKLTGREKEVIDLLALGLTDKEIADKIEISLHTVKTHRKRIVQKTNSRNSAEAVNKYLAISANSF